MGVDLSDGLIALKPHSEWTRAHSKEELVEVMQATLLDSVPGVNFGFSQPIELRVNELIEGVRSDVAIVLYGDDIAELGKTGAAIAGAVQKVQGAADVKVEQVAGLPMLRVEVDPEKIARLGLSAEDVLDSVKALGGKEVGTVIQGQRRYALQVRFPPDVRTSAVRVGQILVGRDDGARVPLAQVADLVEEEGPLQVSHDGGRRRLTVEVNVRGRDIAGFVAEAQRVMDAQVKLPMGYSVEWGGSFKRGCTCRRGHRIRGGRMIEPAASRTCVRSGPENSDRTRINYACGDSSPKDADFGDLFNDLSDLFHPKPTPPRSG
jgi:cobalt-zinc-cadmium resistance protein CzcA